ncbi:hypothetical protein ACFQ1M_14995 [Sungkyunkwania multivorans]|uniref:Uncharacterized protein n=1 Tax=Sungkyunkwania multivorans TaxID=1173618 RepID=A0ABW3D3E9_9FLAO
MKNLFVLFIALLAGCQDLGQLSFVCDLPKSLKENSGIEMVKEDGLIWFVEDSGNKDHIYGVNFEGTIERDINIKNAKNEDWEDLTKDTLGNLYIGDFGNNENDRKDLVIYKIPNPENTDKDDLEAEKIKFSFPEQKEFPPEKDELLYDVEAFFYFEGWLYLFTRNRMSKKHFDGRSLIYKIPAIKGDHKAMLVKEFFSCEEAASCQITSATISPDLSKVVLLGYDRLWVLTNYLGDKFTESSIETIKLGHYSQKEAVCFKNDSTLLISDEADPHGGRNLYSFQLKN